MTHNHHPHLVIWGDSGDDSDTREIRPIPILLVALIPWLFITILALILLKGV